MPTAPRLAAAGVCAVFGIRIVKFNFKILEFQSKYTSLSVAHSRLRSNSLRVVLGRQIEGLIASLPFQQKHL